MQPSWGERCHACAKAAGVPEYSQGTSLPTRRVSLIRTSRAAADTESLVLRGDGSYLPPSAGGQEHGRVKLRKSPAPVRRVLLQVLGLPSVQGFADSPAMAASGHQWPAWYSSGAIRVEGLVISAGAGTL